MLDMGCWFHGGVNVDVALMVELGGQEVTDTTELAVLTGFRLRNNVPEVCCFGWGDV